MVNKRWYYFERILFCPESVEHGRTETKWSVRFQVHVTWGMTNYRIDRIGTDFDHIDMAKQGQQGMKV